MKQKNWATVPFLAMILFIVIYRILDAMIFVNVFGCGCEPGFNANDLQKRLFIAL